MNYEQTRDKIQDGDIISVRGKRGFVANLTKLITRSNYTHSGIAIWIEGGLWMAEINSGHNHLVPLSQLENTDFDVSDCPVDRTLVRDSILKSLRVSVHYNLVSFVIIGLANLFRIKERFHSMTDKVCSEYVQEILITCGWKFPDNMVSPSDLFKNLKLKFEVRY